MVDKHHPLAKKTITLEDYLSYPHAVLHSGLGPIPIDVALKKNRSQTKAFEKKVQTLLPL